MNLQILIVTFVVLTAFQCQYNKQVEEDALDVFDDKGESLELKTFAVGKVENGDLYRIVCTDTLRALPIGKINFRRFSLKNL